jgi:heme-degrading monooxygenase HmoA
MPPLFRGISREAPEASTQNEEDTMTTSKRNLCPVIARIWRGRTTVDKADEYARYLYEHGVKPLAEKALGVQMFREDRRSESEFVTISYWESVEAMTRFAGKDPRRIRHLERDAEFLIELPSAVQILDIVASIGQTGAKES